MNPGFKVRRGRHGGIRVDFDGCKDLTSVLSWSEAFGWRRMDRVGSWHPCVLIYALVDIGLPHLEPLLSDPAHLLLTYEVMET